MKITKYYPNGQQVIENVIEFFVDTSYKQPKIFFSKSLTEESLRAIELDYRGCDKIEVE